MSPLDRPAPPAGEDIHLPGPTITPALVAFGLAVGLVGVTYHWYLIVIGAVIMVAAAVRWLLDVRRSIDELPPSH